MWAAGARSERTAMTSLSSLHLVWWVTSMSKLPSSHTLPVFFMVEIVTLSMRSLSCTAPGKMLHDAALHVAWYRASLARPRWATQRSSNGGGGVRGGSSPRTKQRRVLLQCWCVARHTAHGAGWRRAARSINERRLPRASDPTFRKTRVHARARAMPVHCTRMDQDRAALRGAQGRCPGVCTYDASSSMSWWYSAYGGFSGPTLQRLPSVLPV